MATTAEVFAWPEGEVLLWTGSATPYAVGYANGVAVQVTEGWRNRGPSLGGTYNDFLTGRIAYVNVRAGYTYDADLIGIMQAGTAVHCEVRHSGINGTAGVVLHSGRLSNLTINGQAGGLFTYSLNYYANHWSAYG